MLIAHPVEGLSVPILTTLSSLMELSGEESFLMVQVLVGIIKPVSSFQCWHFCADDGLGTEMYPSFLGFNFCCTVECLSSHLPIFHLSHSHTDYQTLQIFTTTHPDCEMSSDPDEL